MASRVAEEGRSQDSPNAGRSPSVHDDSDIPSSSEEEDDEDGDLCPECEPRHVRRRLIVCVDGTWMVADGAIGSFNGNASNMARIWSMVKEGLVRSPDGKRWQQKRVFVEGIGAVSDLIERTYAGITGYGYESKIKFVYKLCCTDMCPGDEMFLFGFSRGAFVVRAVAGLLHHMKVLDVTAPDFDKMFDRAICLYRATQDKSKLYQHQVFQHLSQASKSPTIRFIGVIDTVKALEDDNLNDIQVTDSVHVIRHALALFEKRSLMSPERFNLGRAMPLDHSAQEAWFMGTHGSLGGSNAQDGLSLWPLQWLVSEAKQQNLVFGFKRISSSNVTDPAALVFQRQGDVQRTMTCQNGIKLIIADLSLILSKDGFLPRIQQGKGKFPSPQEFRPLFSKGKLIGQNTTGLTSAFIHPSVFYLDDTDAGTIYLISSHPDSELIRAQRQFSISSNSDIFWAGSEELQLNRQSKRPRILLCGQLNAGKSSLINRMLGYNATTIAHGADPGEHDINVPHSNENRTIVFHDSQGFEAAKASNFEDVESFVKDRRSQPIFEKQIHCIWYCVSTDLQRVQKADKKFAKIDFGGVPIILVFTKSEKLRRTCEEKAVRGYNQEHHSAITIYQFTSLPDGVQQDLSSRIEKLLESEKEQRKSEWSRKFPGLFSDTIFVSNPDSGIEDLDSVNTLMQCSRQSMTGDRMSRIHAQAQDSFVDAKWNDALDEIVRTCNQRGDLISCLKKHDVGKLRREIVQSVTERLAGIFELDGFNHATAVPVISEILYPDLNDGNSSIKKYFATLAGLAIGGVGVALLGPFAWLAAAGSASTLLTVFTDLSNSNLIVLSCLEIAFVIERIFWFGSGSSASQNITDTVVAAATLYHLKRRARIVAAGRKALDLFDNIREMKPVLARIVGEFRYKRQNVGSCVGGDDEGEGEEEVVNMARPVPP